VSIRHNRALSDVFKLFNSLKDGVLSCEDMSKLFAKLEIFLDEAEIRRAMKVMDGGDNRLEEKDFIAFMKQEPALNFNKAQRLQESSVALRGWIQRHSATADGT